MFRAGRLYLFCFIAAAMVAGLPSLAYGAEYCDCGLGESVRRKYSSVDDRREQIETLVRCTECDVLEVVNDIHKKKELKAGSPPDGSSLGRFEKRFISLVNSYPAEINALFANALRKNASSGPFGPECCFVSNVIAAQSLGKTSYLDELSDIDCTAFPEVLRIKKEDYLVFIPVGQGSFRKAHLAFKVVKNGASFMVTHLPFEWYDPYQEKIVERDLLGMTQSTFSWEEFSGFVVFTSSDPYSSCYGFSAKFSVGEQQLALEKSDWVYVCSTMNGSLLCPVPLFDKKSGFKGKLLKNTVACEQPNAQQAQWF